MGYPFITCNPISSFRENLKSIKIRFWKVLMT